MLKRRSEVPDREAPPTLAQLAPEVSAELPELVQFIACSIWPSDGSPRRTGTLLVCVGDGRWRACLNDRAQGLAAWLSHDTLEGLLVALEDSLREDRLEWRKSDPPAKRK